MNYRNAKFGLNQTFIECEIEESERGWIPRTVYPSNIPSQYDPVGLFEQIVEDGEVADMTQEEIDAEVSNRARLQRDSKLQIEVDPWVTNNLRWDDLNSEKQQEWLDYRRALLDLPEQEGWPYEIVWPSKPD